MPNVDWLWHYHSVIYNKKQKKTLNHIQDIRLKFGERYFFIENLYTNQMINFLSNNVLKSTVYIIQYKYKKQKRGVIKKGFTNNKQVCPSIYSLNIIE